MLIAAPWPDLPPDLHDPEAAAEMDWVVAAISAIRAIRTEVNVPAGARLPLLVKDADPAVAARLELHAEHIRRLARIERIEHVDAVPAGGVAAVVEGTTLILRVGDVIDLAKEKARLAKEIGRLDADLAKIRRQAQKPGLPRQGQARGRSTSSASAKPTRSRDRDRLRAVYDRIAAG